MKIVIVMLMMKIINQLLFKLRKNVIPDKLCKIGIANLKKAPKNMIIEVLLLELLISKN